MGSKPLEVWFIRGRELMRLHGQCPASARGEHPDEILVALQPVQNGMVLAWEPILREWMVPGKVEEMVAALKAEGWVASPRRPGIPGEAPPPNLSERIESAKAKDRERKRLMRQDLVFRAMRRAV